MGKLIKTNNLRNSKSSAKPNKSRSITQNQITMKKKKSHVLKLSKVSVNLGIKKVISKKEKQKMKAQKLKAQIEKTKESFREEKARLKREKRPIVGDLKPLLDSLPSLDELLSIRDSNRTGIASIDRDIKKQPRNRRLKKALMNHEKTEKMLDRFDHVNKVWRDPEFQKNPRSVIAERIRQRRLQMTNETEN